MRKTKTEKIEQEVIEDILCNKCGESCKVETGEFYCASIRYSTGYWSSTLPDGRHYGFDLCEKCLAEIIDSLKIDPDEEWYL